MIRRGIGVQSFVSAGVSTDADAQAFITAAGITDATQQSAINTLVTDLKGYSIWSKMKAIYPFVGGTSSTHKWNLKDPRDLDAAFRLVFSGGWTHSSTGALPNGTNGYADSKLNASTILTANNTHITYYSRTNITGVTSMDIGAYGATRFQMTLAWLNNFESDQYNFSTGRVSTTISDTRGFFVSSRTNSSTHKAFRNSTQLGSTNTGSSGNLPNAVFQLGGGNGFWSKREVAFASIGDGLTDTEAANFYTAVQAYQTTLGRSIGTQTVSDADAQAFVNAAVIEDQVQATAINTLVTDLKGYGVWTKMKAIYPFVGGTATTHKWNLKDPRDLDAAFRLVFSGGGTHASTGWLPNGTNGYADTKLNPSGLINANNISISTYLRTNTDGVFCDIGASTNATTVLYQYSIYARLSNVAYADLGSQSAGRITYANTDSRGHFISTRISSTSFKGFQNSTLKATLTTLQTQSILSRVLFLGAMNDSISTIQFSNRELAFAHIGDGLTDTEASNLYTAVQAYQTTLSRNV